MPKTEVTPQRKPVRRRRELPALEVRGRGGQVPQAAIQIVASILLDAVDAEDRANHQPAERPAKKGSEVNP